MHEGLTLPRRAWAVISVSAGSMLYTLDGSIPNVGLPTISRALDIAPASSVLLVSAYNLVLAMVLLPLAAIGDRVGHRLIFISGLLLYLAAAVGCAVADNLPMLLLARAFQALAAGAVLSVSLAMVRAIYPSKYLGRGLGVNTIAASMGAAIAPAVGGLILSVASWHWMFGAGAPLAILALLCSASLPDGDQREMPFDALGAVLCALTFGLLIGGCQLVSEGHRIGLATALIVGGIAVAVIFVRHEFGTTSPVLPVDLLATPSLALSVGGALLAVLSSTALLLYLPFRLAEIGFAPAAVGAMIAPYAVAVMIAAPASGMLSDRVSPSKLGTAGLVIAVVATVCLAYVPSAPSYYDVAWRTALCGVGFSMFFSPNGRLVVGAVPRSRAAGASSLLSTTRMFGQALGSTLLGGLLAMPLGAAAPGLSAALLAGLACILSLARVVVAEPDT
jgi:DHA2 family multidrug resistance protein-like MFS transporter